MMFRTGGFLGSAVIAFGFLLLATAGLADSPEPKTPHTWPQAYSVDRNDATGILTLRTPYYTVEQNLKQGGTITRIALTHGKAANLLVGPIETRIRAENGAGRYASHGWLE
jgi:hypothetical protein